MRRVLALWLFGAVAAANACGSGGPGGESDSANPPDSGPAAQDGGESAEVEFSTASDVCDLLSVDEISAAVGQPVHEPRGFDTVDTNDIDTLGCVWDTGPEFVPGDNSTVELTVRDVTFAEFLGDNPAGWAADVSETRSSLRGHPTWRTSMYAMELDFGAWHIGIVTYAGHDSQGRASPDVSMRANAVLLGIVTERLEGVLPSTASSQPVARPPMEEQAPVGFDEFTAAVAEFAETTDGFADVVVGEPAVLGETSYATLYREGFEIGFGIFEKRAGGFVMVDFVGGLSELCELGGSEVRETFACD